MDRLKAAIDVDDYYEALDCIYSTSGLNWDISSVNFDKYLKLGRYGFHWLLLRFFFSPNIDSFISDARLLIRMNYLLYFTEYLHKAVRSILDKRKDIIIVDNFLSLLFHCALQIPDRLSFALLIISAGLDVNHRKNQELILCHSFQCQKWDSCCRFLLKSAIIVGLSLKKDIFVQCIKSLPFDLKLVGNYIKLMKCVYPTSYELRLYTLQWVTPFSEAFEFRRTLANIRTQLYWMRLKSALITRNVPFFMSQTKVLIKQAYLQLTSKNLVCARNDTDLCGTSFNNMEQWSIKIIEGYAFSPSDIRNLLRPQETDHLEARNPYSNVKMEAADLIRFDRDISRFLADWYECVYFSGWWCDITETKVKTRKSDTISDDGYDQLAYPPPISYFVNEHNCKAFLFLLIRSYIPTPVLHSIFDYKDLFRISQACYAHITYADVTVSQIEGVCFDVIRRFLYTDDKFRDSRLVWLVLALRNAAYRSDDIIHQALLADDDV